MVKPGYKQTEVGVIPEHWRISSLATAFQRLETGVSVNSDDSLSSEYHILKTSAVHHGVVDTAETKPVIPRDYPRLKCPLVKGSIIISRMNTPALVGECGFAKDTKAGTYLPDRLWQIQNLNTGSFDFVWLNYLLNSKQYRDAVRATATGTSNSMKNISKERLLDIKIPHPPISEQADIAVALLEVDELINLIEKQISKKKAIKQGTMQELLTGKKRLPGYESPWIGKRLRDIAPLQRGFDLPYSELAEGHVPAVFSNGINAYHRVAMVKGPGIVTGRSGTIGKLHYIDSDYWPHNTTLWVTDFKGNNPRFIYYLLHLVNWTDYMTGSGVPTLNRNDVHTKIISIPEDAEEQKAIAAILLSMDSEIEALGKKVAKYRQVKQGMMQQLLTGKIRLV